MFVDRVRVHLRAGNGGAGVVSFVRQRGRPKGKPVGGSGGSGGDVIIEVDEGAASLLAYRRNPHHAASPGAHGQGDLKHGRSGEALVLHVPPGTVIIDDEGTVVADLVVPGQRYTAVEGGHGGRGNAALVSPSLKAPSVCEQGEFGRAEWFTFELKLMADAALVGFPNSGKSTFISAVSAAKPKIASYPFTTLEPHLGVVSAAGREFVLADIPGLIEGAASGKGLGHEFLRHVERARVLVILLDPSPLQEKDPSEQLEILLRELEEFSAELADRPRVVVVSKADLPDAAAWSETLGAHLASAATGEGIPSLLHVIADLAEEAERQAPEREGFVLHRPAEALFTLRRDFGTWVVEGVMARRAVRFADLTNPVAADLAAQRLARLKVDEALAAAGAVEGETVRIGDLEFVYVPADEEDE